MVCSFPYILLHPSSTGQLCRERFGNEALLVGFGTARGSVAAASNWDDPMEVKQVNMARNDSFEGLCHRSSKKRFLLDLKENRKLKSLLKYPRLERAIGVIYRPDTELQSHYFEASLSRQFDYYVWFDSTEAVTPLPTKPLKGQDETWPFGL